MKYIGRVKKSAGKREKKREGKRGSVLAVVITEGKQAAPGAPAGERKNKSTYHCSTFWVNVVNDWHPKGEDACQGQCGEHFKFGL